MGYFDFNDAPAQQGAPMGLLDQIGGRIADNSNGLIGFGLNLMAGGPDAMQRAALQAMGQKMGAPAEFAGDDRALTLWIAQKNHQDAMGHQSAQDAESKRRWDAGQSLEREKWDWTRANGTPTSVEGQIAQREKAATRLGLTPDNPAYQPFILTGKYPREDQASLSATDKKEKWEQEDALPVIDDTLGKLKRAKELNRQTFTGWSSEYLSNLGTSDLPGTGLIDRSKSEATREFSDLMKMESIQTMVGTLK